MSALWQRVLHSALMGERMRPPETYGVDGIGSFLVSAAVALAAVTMVQRRQVVAVIASLALALLARGAFDSPLRAIAVVAAAQWIVVASVDDRAMWRSLLDQRNKKVGAPAPRPAVVEAEPPAKPAVVEAEPAPKPAEEAEEKPAG
jgi:hypothetical protein